MINSAIQEGISVRILGSSGQTLFTKKGELLGFTSSSVTIRRENFIYIYNTDGSTQCTRRYQGGRTAYDDLVEEEANKPGITWTPGTIILYLLFGWLIKIGAGYRLYERLCRPTAIGDDGGDLVWKDIGIWLMSVIFWIGCIAGYYHVTRQIGIGFGDSNTIPYIEDSTTPSYE